MTPFGCAEENITNISGYLLTFSIWLMSSRLLLILSIPHWGTTVDFTTSFLQSSRLSAFRSKIFHSRPVHSLMLSSHHFFCLPLRLPPWTVPCRTVLASADDRVTCPYHFSLCLFTEVRMSTYGPMALPFLAFTSSLVIWPLYDTKEDDNHSSRLTSIKWRVLVKNCPPPPPPDHLLGSKSVIFSFSFWR